MTHDTEIFRNSNRVVEAVVDGEVAVERSIKSLSWVIPFILQNLISVDRKIIRTRLGARIIKNCCNNR